MRRRVFVSASHLARYSAGVSSLRGEELVGVEAEGLLELSESGGVGESEHQREDAGPVDLGVGVSVADLHAVEALHGVVRAFLDVREEDEAAVGADRFNEGGGGFLHPIHDRSGGIDEEAAILGAGQEEDAVMKSPPGVGDEILGWSVVVGQEDGADAGAPGVGEHFGARPAGVRRIFGVGVEDGAVVVESGERWERLAGLLDPGHVFVSGFQAGECHPLGGGIPGFWSLSLRGHRRGCQDEAEEEEGASPPRSRIQITRFHRGSVRRWCGVGWSIAGRWRRRGSSSIQ